MIIAATFLPSSPLISVIPARQIAAEVSTAICSCSINVFTAGSNLDSFIKVMKLIEDKVFFPFVDKVYNFSDIKKAHTRIEERNQFGKVVLVP